MVRTEVNLLNLEKVKKLTKLFKELLENDKLPKELKEEYTIKIGEILNENT